MKTIYAKDYVAPAFEIQSVELDFTLNPTETIVKSHMLVRRLPGKTDDTLLLNGTNLQLISLKLNQINWTDFKLSEEGMTLYNLPESFELDIKNSINPAANTRLMGLYISNDLFCTQCEPEGFRAITYYPDHPDVMSKFTVTIHADRKRYPVVLSNGNCIQDDNDTVIFEDPFRKPSYLFALVAGQLEFIEDRFTTCSGRNVRLRIYAEPGKKERLGYAMDSLKRAMKWDEEAFGREYDLDSFNIVAVRDFNAGAMENKSLNIFNDQCLLADPQTATDANYANIEGVVAHEYFHNWSGDRVTARDWFNLSLKEGFTVYRDQEFSAHERSATVKRIQDVAVLKNYQFPEDDGPLAHPVRPAAYHTIDNFYTTTVYDKGAEVIRMQEKILGKDGFRKGCDLYFSRHDGQAVTIDDFVKCMEDANNTSLSGIFNWYSIAGRPVIKVEQEYNDKTKIYTLKLKQNIKNLEAVFPSPLSMGLLDNQGRELFSQTLLFEQKEQSWRFPCENRPILSINRGFSAPVTLDITYTDEERARLIQYDTDDFNRYAIGQEYAADEIIKHLQDGQVSETFIDAFSSYLNDTKDPAFVAEALSFPSSAYIGEKMPVFDVDAVWELRLKTRTALAQKNKQKFIDLYNQLSAKGPFSLDAKAASQRALKNTALSYLALLPECHGLVAQAYQQADNMTDRLAALTALVCNGLPFAEQASQDFYQMYHQDHLVMNKWFAVHASAQCGDVLRQVKKLADSAVFNILNPNNARALYGSFGRNLKYFHAKDGSGYKLIQEVVASLDPVNPNLAERLVHPLVDLRKYDEQRQEMMKHALLQLQRIPNLSVNVRSTIEKALNA